MYREKKHLWFYKYCSTYSFKFFTTDIWYSSLLFINVVLTDSPTYYRNTTDIPPPDQRVNTTLPAITFTTHFQTDQLITWGKSKLISRSVWTWVAEVIAGNVVITRWSGGGMSVVWQWIYKDNVCKEQWWALNIRGKKF